MNERMSKKWKNKGMKEMNERVKSWMKDLEDETRNEINKWKNEKFNEWMKYFKM